MFSSGVLVEQSDLSLWRYDVTSGGDVARPWPPIQEPEASCVCSKETSNLFNKAVSCFTGRDLKQVSLPVDDLGITACHRVSKGNPIMVPPRKSWFMDLGILGGESRHCYL